MKANGTHRRPPVAGRRHRRRRTLTVAVAALGMAISTTMFGIWQASAVHDTGVFQLDGNAQSSVQSVPPASDDWDKVCHEAAPTICPSGVNTTGATAVAFTNDGAVNATIFTTGGSKDPSDISSWQWKNELGGLPAKDNLQNSYAARYSVPPSATCQVTAGATSCELLYFGSDRLDNSGDAQEGFWFFQNKITTDPATGKFNGVHKVGDLLILSDFSNGGGTSTINIYKWVGSGGDTNGTLNFVAGGTSAKCGGSSPDAFCGIVNPTDGTPVPWAFTDKSGNSTYLNGEFYEGGINLSDPSINLGGECFASVSSETRASTSPTATLKDFVLGNFGACGSSTVTTPQQSDGTGIPAGGLSIGTGSVQAQDQAVVTATGGAGVKPTGTVSFFICGPQAAPALCDTGGTAVGVRTLTGTVNPATVVSDLVTLTSAGRYCFRAVYSGDAAKGIPGSSDSSATECFVVNPVTPSLATTGGPDVLLGNPITDTATLTGTANKPGTPVINPTTAGGPAGGSITFSLFGPSDTGCGALFGTVTPATTVSGDWTYGPVSLTPTAIGTYHWVASYTGDSPNTLATDHNTACTDTAEDVVVISVPSSLSSTQSFIPNDSVTVSASQGGNLAGSVHVQLFETTDCTGNVLHDQTLTVSGASPQTVNTTNTTHSTTSANVSWLITYTSTNPAQRSIPANCLEKTALSIDNGGTISSP